MMKAALILPAACVFAFEYDNSVMHFGAETNLRSMQPYTTWVHDVAALTTSGRTFGIGKEDLYDDRMSMPDALAQLCSPTDAMTHCFDSGDLDGIAAWAPGRAVITAPDTLHLDDSAHVVVESSELVVQKPVFCHTFEDRYWCHKPDEADSSVRLFNVVTDIVSQPFQKPCQPLRCPKAELLVMCHGLGDDAGCHIVAPGDMVFHESDVATFV